MVKVGLIRSNSHSEKGVRETVTIYHHKELVIFLQKLVQMSELLVLVI